MINLRFLNSADCLYLSQWCLSKHGSFLFRGSLPSIFPFVVCASGVTFKMPLATPRPQRYRLVFFPMNFIVLSQSSDICLMNSLSMVRGGYSVVPASFLEKTILSHTELFWHPCQNQLTINAWVCFRISILSH